MEDRIVEFANVLRRNGIRVSLSENMDAFRALGARVDDRPEDIVLTAPSLGLSPCDFLMDEPSVMATENALMAAALTRGPTVIRNAASEPHVQDLARMLIQMGAAIDGVGSNVMTVHGQAALRGCTYEIAPDHIIAGTRVSDALARVDTTGVHRLPPRLSSLV